MGSERFSKSVESGYNKGMIRSDIRHLVLSKDVRRHRLISISYITTLSCHGRGREFESRRPRHSFQKSCIDFSETIEDPKGQVFVPFFVSLLVFFFAADSFTLQRQQMKAIAIFH